MAGSYNHIITDQGNLRSNESFAQSIENLGDAYEAVEEMYGMIWWLALLLEEAYGEAPAKELVENARQNYLRGLRLAKEIKDKGKSDGS